MDVTYVIVKVYVTECNDVIKCHSNRTSLNATVMALQNGGRQQSKLLHY